MTDTQRRSALAVGGFVAALVIATLLNSLTLARVGPFGIVPTDLIAVFLIGGAILAVVRTPRVTVGRDVAVFAVLGVGWLSYVVLAGAVLRPGTVVLDTMLRLFEMLFVGFFVPYVLFRRIGGQRAALIAVRTVAAATLGAYVVTDLLVAEPLAVLPIQGTVIGVLAGVLLLYAVAVLLTRSLDRILQNGSWIVVCGLTVLVMFRTASFSELFAALVAAGLLLHATAKRTVWTSASLAGSFFVAGIVFVSIYQISTGGFDRLLLTLTQFRYTEVTGRMVFSIAGLLLFFRNPVFGTGWGATAERVYQPPLLEVLFPGHPPLDQGTHNLYVKVAAETGIVGLALALAACAFLLRSVVRGFRTGAGRRRDKLFELGIVVLPAVWFAINRFSAGSVILLLPLLGAAALAAREPLADTAETTAGD